MNEITHDIEVEQVYKDSRTGERMQLIYIDQNIYVMQNSGGTHRLGDRAEFEKNVLSDRYTYLPDDEPFATTQASGDSKKIPFEELDSIGETAAENLRNEGYETCNDVRRVTDDDLTDVSWVGDAGVESIREHCK